MTGIFGALVVGAAGLYVIVRANFIASQVAVRQRRSGGSSFEVWFVRVSGLLILSGSIWSAVA